MLSVNSAHVDGRLGLARPRSASLGPAAAAAAAARDVAAAMVMNISATGPSAHRSASR